MHKEQLEEKKRHREKKRQREKLGLGLEEGERSEEQNANRERVQKANKSQYDALDPAKKKARLQQIKEQSKSKRAPPVPCSCRKKFGKPFNLKQHLFGRKDGRSKPPREPECVAAR